MEYLIILVLEEDIICGKETNIAFALSYQNLMIGSLKFKLALCMSATFSKKEEL